MSLQKLVTLAEEYKKTAQREGKKAVVEAIKGLFDTFPELTAVKWLQYTPYFNDGDPCEFGLRGVGFYTTDTKDSEDEDEESENVYDHEAYGLEKTHPELAKAAHEFEKDLSTIEDTLQYVFGDHVQVTCRRAKDGDPDVEIEEYEHD